MEILEGYRRRDSGEARVLGQDPQRAGAAWRARRGIVLQSCEDVVDLTVSECVRHFSHFYPAPADPAEVIEQVGLTAKKDSRIRALSGGQRRRLDVALGIVGRPELVFLDEPTTGFDPEARHQFWGVVRELAKEGTSVLLTTHYLEEAEALADRVAVINNGKVIEAGPPSELGLTPPRLAVEGASAVACGLGRGPGFRTSCPRCALSALRPLRPAPAPPCPRSALPPLRPAPSARSARSARPLSALPPLGPLRPLRPAPALHPAAFWAR